MECSGGEFEEDVGDEKLGVDDETQILVFMIA